MGGRRNYLGFWNASDDCDLVNIFCIMKPIAFIRPDDWEVFSLNSDGETYSLERMKKDFPGHLHMEYPIETMRVSKFHEVWPHQD